MIETRDIAGYQVSIFDRVEDAPTPIPGILFEAYAQISEDTWIGGFTDLNYVAPYASRFFAVTRAELYNNVVFAVLDGLYPSPFKHLSCTRIFGPNYADIRHTAADNIRYSYRYHILPENRPLLNARCGAAELAARFRTGLLPKVGTIATKSYMLRREACLENGIVINTNAMQKLSYSLITLTYNASRAKKLLKAYRRRYNYVHHYHLRECNYALRSEIRKYIDIHWPSGYGVEVECIGLMQAIRTFDLLFGMDAHRRVRNFQTMVRTWRANPQNSYDYLVGRGRAAARLFCDWFAQEVGRPLPKLRSIWIPTELIEFKR